MNQIFICQELVKLDSHTNMRESTQAPMTCVKQSQIYCSLNQKSN